MGLDPLLVLTSIRFRYQKATPYLSPRWLEPLFALKPRRLSSSDSTVTTAGDPGLLRNRCRVGDLATIVADPARVSNGAARVHGLSAEVVVTDPQSIDNARCVGMAVGEPAWYRG